MDIDEKRVYDEVREVTVAYVATGEGLATVELSGDRIGRFALAHRGQTRDVAAGDGVVYVATREDVVVGTETFERTGFGGAVAVAVADAPLAADGDGRISRHVGGEWSVVGSVETVRRMDGDLLAATDGVYRVGVDGLDYVGLDDVRDVAAAGIPLAATGDGLYRLGNGWQRVLDGSFTTVAADADRAHAATTDRLYAYADEIDGWRTRSLPVDESVADVAYGEHVYAVTGSGTVLVDAAPWTTTGGTGSWRSQSIDLSDVAALAVLPSQSG